VALQIPSDHGENLLTRRGIFVGAAASLICAPAIVRATSLMQVRGWILPFVEPAKQGPYYAGFVERLRYQYIAGALRRGWEEDQRRGSAVPGLSESDGRKAVAHAFAQGWLDSFTFNGGPNG
jgi:hypothetical protein